MRIIDKNTDFYDFWQGIYRDHSITFDRRDSFELTKELMISYVYPYYNRFRPVDKNHFILLQICNSFWLFLLKFTDEVVNKEERPKNYTIELITSWKNYDKERCLEKLSIIWFDYNVTRLISECKNNDDLTINKEKIQKYVNTLVEAVNRNNYRVVDTITNHTIYKGDNTKEEKHIPLLKACGIAECVNSLDIYLAFEEYFSKQKTTSERIESVGLTNEEKITNHGFDTKKSFRGK